MSEETKVPRLQDQIDSVDEALSRIPFYLYISFSIAGIAIAIGAALENLYLLMASFVVFLTCMTVSVTQVRSARDKYRKLLEQLNS